MRKLNIDSGKDFAESPIESGDIANINSNSGSLGMAILDQQSNVRSPDFGKVPAKKNEISP